MSIGLVIALPVLMFALGATVQYFVKADAQRTAQAAAEEGAAAARAFDGSEPAAQARAEEFLDSVDNDGLTDVEITASREGAEASVTVTGSVQSVGWIPFFDETVTETSTGPVERYVD